MKAYLGNRLLGDFPCAHWGSIAFLCPVCGEVWGRLVGKEECWRSLDRACPSHFIGGETGRELVPGSFLFALIWRVPESLLIAHMSAGVRAHEVKVILNEALRREKDMDRKLA